MKVIVITGKKNGKKARLMLELMDRNAIKHIKKLISAWKCTEAISKILSKGTFIKELTATEATFASSELILTDTNAYWNLL